MIDILIPTYNRKGSLIKNLGLICDQVRKLTVEVFIIISDNASTDGTAEAVNEFIDSNSNLRIKLIVNDENIGLEENTLRVASAGSSEYAMFLGDDDYLHNDYLNFCIDSISKHSDLGSILPGKVSLFEDGTISQPANTQDYFLKSGYEGALLASHFASQMSGLLLYKPKEIIESYLVSGYRSIYLFIYFFTYNMLRYETIIVNSLPTKVTTFNAKDWSYNNIGLLDEIFKAYLAFDKELGRGLVDRLIVKFIKMHGWRLGIEVKNPFLSLSRFFSVWKTLPQRNSLRMTLLVQFIREYLYRIRKGNI